MGASMSGRTGRMLNWVSTALMGERERWPLWSPVAIGAGVAIYFAWPTEPPWTVAVAAALIGALVFWLGRRRSVAAICGIGLLLAALGFAAGQWRSAAVWGPILDDEIGPALVTGTVAAVEPHARGQRIIIAQPSIEDLAPERTPGRVRLTASRSEETFYPGDRIEALAIVRPPPPPIAPGAFDFRRHLYFQRIGGIGFTLGAPTKIDTRSADFRAGLSGLRQRVDERIRARLDPPSGAVASALLTGRRGAIEPAVIDAMRASGLAHLLAISGLHIGLVAGTVFFFVRLLLAAMPGVALRRPIKKWAAAAALAVAFAYMLLAGASVPTQRSFVMIAFVLVAVMVDRTGLSMRFVAWAATLVLLLAPESLLSASFQLSFAAVVALIATYESLRDPLVRLRAALPVWALPALYLFGVALTSVVATLATAPFAVFHFNRLAVYGLVANLVAVPVTAFWVMPLGLVALLAMPFGLEALPLAAMAEGIDLIILVARAVAGWTGAVRHIAAPPLWGLVAVVAGGLWLCLWRHRIRWFGWATIGAGALSVLTVVPPDILVANDNRLAAVRDRDGTWLFSEARYGGFVREGWLRRWAIERWARWPEAGESAGGGLRCDPLGCLYDGRHGRTVALVRDPRAAAEDCARVDVVVALVPLDATCLAKAGIVIGPLARWRNGAHVVWMGEDDIVVRSVGREDRARPWTP